MSQPLNADQELVSDVVACQLVIGNGANLLI